jgi:GMP synthase (glutamine-hydrolysing)
VRPHTVREIGWYRLQPTAAAQSDRLCQHFDGSQHVFQWHAYTFDLPHGAVHLASTPTCPNQAFRHGERAYGLQFHLEADQELIQRWLHVPEYRAEVEAAGPDHQLEHLLRDTHGHVVESRRLSERVFGDFIALFNLPPKVRLTSR